MPSVKWIHINPNNFTKMRVKDAVHIISRTMCICLNLADANRVPVNTSLVHYLTLGKLFFDSLNHKKLVVSVDDEIIKDLDKMVAFYDLWSIDAAIATARKDEEFKAEEQQHLEEIAAMPKNAAWSSDRKVRYSIRNKWFTIRKTNKAPTMPCWELVQDTKNTVLAIKDYIQQYCGPGKLLPEGMKPIWFCQDVVENLFSILRKDKVDPGFDECLLTRKSSLI